MEALPLPNHAQVKDLGNNKYSIILEPLYPGYGVTIGNAMRRVLLSSMPGSAVTSVKIKYVDHEFSTIPNVKEDVIQIILNLKQLRVKSFSNEPVRLALKEKGERIVTAASFKENDQVQIINKDLHIATLDNKTSDLEMEIVVEQGKGYLPVEARDSHKPEIGMIGIDAIFTPIKSVHFDISNVRVGQLTNYDKLELIMETDGSISGAAAIDIASHILVDHFTMMFNTDLGKVEETVAGLPSENIETISADGPAVLEDEISISTLSTRAKNALKKNGIMTLAALKALSSEEIGKMQGLGEKTIKEILEFIAR